MRKIDLGGIWDFVADLDPKYHKSPAYASPEWDRSKWDKVVVPGVWNLYGDKYSLYEGVSWYVRDFDYHQKIGEKTAVLRLGGDKLRCEVFLNGKLAGEHEGGYTGFSVDVSSLLKEGKNTLAVKVDNRSHLIKLPAVLGWFNYGGIHRQVSLELYPDTYLADLTVQAKHNGLLSINGKIVSSSRNYFQVEIRCADVTKRLEKVRNFLKVEVKIPNVKSWSGENPAFYSAEISLLSEGILLEKKIVPVGFRSLVAKGRQLFLNGKRIFLKGLNYLYDSPAHGLVMKKRQYQKDIFLLKELGVNIIRSHFPFPEEFLSECDRQGLMVWIDIPVYCLSPEKGKGKTVFSDKSYQKLALRMMEEMIRQSRNHPAVVIYGIGNECETESLAAERFFRKICQKAREMDDKLLAYASLYGRVGRVGKMVDIVGVNEYWGWYDVIDKGEKVKKINLEKLKEKLKELTGRYKKPLVISEFGADAIPGYISRSCRLWSEDYSARFLKKSFEVFKKYPVCGTFPFCFSDYKDPSKYINKYWDGMNYKGLVTYDRRLKKPFFTLRAIYKSKRGDT